MSIDSAQVTTLTAEVRTLMVGSRQVTRSVFRQLDFYKWWVVEPFGRVNESLDESYRADEDGDICPRGTPSYRSVERRVVDLRKMTWDAYGDRCYREQVIYRRFREQERCGIDWEWVYPHVVVVGRHIETGALVMSYLGPSVDETCRRHRTYLAWCDLPLIVLAGLR